MPKSQTGRTLQSTTSTSKTATDEGEPASAQSVAGAASNPEPQDEQDQELTEPTRPPLAGDTAYHYVQPVPPDFEADVDWGRSDSEASSDRYTTATPRGGGDAAKNAQPQPAKTDLAGGAKTAYT